jgi:hypothetical protein
MCISFKVGTVSQADYDIHVAKKNEARDAKNKAKDSASVHKIHSGANNIVLMCYTAIYQSLADFIVLLLLIGHNKSNNSMQNLTLLR